MLYTVYIYGDPSGGHCAEEDGVAAIDLRRRDTDSAAEDGFSNGVVSEIPGIDRGHSAGNLPKSW